MLLLQLLLLQQSRSATDWSSYLVVPAIRYVRVLNWQGTTDAVAGVVCGP